MPETSPITNTFPTLAAAHSAKMRLLREGFARNSIDIDRNADDLFDVTISTREENRARAERALTRGATGQTYDALTANPILFGMGLAALAGIAFYALLNRRETYR
ncbi:MAG: hypothetical protein EOP83_02195 [Verrucomicrobiaceae bacterium]|nr:MAG: hypothetical protein EOP83_02195 [Verrucomicrobiaceae bacterium]